MRVEVLERGPTIDAAFRRQCEQTHEFLAGRFGLFSCSFVSFKHFGVDASGSSVHESDMTDGAPHEPERPLRVDRGFYIERVDL